MKRITGLSLALLLALSAHFSPALAGGTTFFTVQKYYIGEFLRFGNDFSHHSAVCHDFNADGVGDLFFLKPYDAGNPVIRGTILFGSGSGTFPTKLDIEVPGNTYAESGYYALRPLPLDANGDGLCDLLTADYWADDYRYNVHINTGTPVWTTFTGYYAFWSPYDGLTLREVLAACDCNGDGKGDFMGTSLGLNDSYVQPVMVIPMSISSGFTIPTYLMNTSGFANWTDAGVGDFNGDGIHDFLERSYYSGVRIHAGLGSCQFYLFGGAGTVLSGYARIGNFNGDQYDDFIHTHEMMCTPSSYYASVIFGGSDGLRAGPQVSFSRPDYFFPIVVADINSDRLDDVGVIDSEYSDSILPIYFYRSVGETFGAIPDTLRLAVAPTSFSYKNEVFSWDFNSDGRDDLLYFPSPDTIGVLLQEGPVATFLRSFAVRLEGAAAAMLEWKVLGKADCASFNVSRSSGDESFAIIASIPADPGEEEYSYIDTDIWGFLGRDVTYRLEAVYEDGSISLLAEGDVTVPRAELALHQNYPNPFNPGTIISFTLPERSRVTLDIYDVTGRLIRRLLDDEEIEAGPREIYWDGLSDTGRSISSGVYYCLLTAGKETVTRKLVLMR